MMREPLAKRGGGTDPLLWAAAFGLMLIGAAFIFSATADADGAAGLPWWRYRAVAHAIAFGVGSAVAAALCIVEYGRLARWSLVAYWFSILLLVAVFVIGVSRNGAKRWIDLGPLQFQPSEFAKIAFLFALANFLSRPIDELRLPGNFVKALAMAILPFGLILKEPDLGSSLVFMPTALVMMLVAGVPKPMLGRFVGGAGILAALILVDVLFAKDSWRFIKLEEYQRRRLLVYFGVDFVPKGATPEEARQARLLQRDTAMNVDQAMISIGSGGITGRGWRQGTQHSLGFLPRLGAHNDFIFSVIAEETGLLGSLTVLSLYGVVFFTGIRIAGEARDRLGRLLAVGVTALLFTHVFVNIGMNLRLMPVTGIPLPLLSAGGTSVLCSLVAIGILQNIHLHRRHY
jgi:rod shape determining protein RodA